MHPDPPPPPPAHRVDPNNSAWCLFCGEPWPCALPDAPRPDLDAILRRWRIGQPGQGVVKTSTLDIADLVAYALHLEREAIAEIRMLGEATEKLEAALKVVEAARAFAHTYALSGMSPPLKAPLKQLRAAVEVWEAQHAAD